MNKKLPVSVIVTGLLVAPLAALPAPADAALAPMVELQEAASTGFPAEMPAEVSRRLKRWMRGERPDVGGMQALQEQLAREIQAHLADARAHPGGWIMAPIPAVEDLLSPHGDLYPQLNVDVVQSIPSHEAVTFLGVATEQVSPPLGSQLNLPAGTGLVVVMVAPDSPAAKAGVALNDVLLKFDDQLLINAAQFQTLVRDKKSGDTVALTLMRNGKTVTAQVTLGERDSAVMGEAIPAPQAAGAGGAATVPAPANARTPGPNTDSVSIQRDDGAYDISLRIDGGKRHLVVKELITGKKLYDGPGDSPADWKDLPDDVQKRIAAVLEKVDTLHKAD